MVGHVKQIVFCEAEYIPCLTGPAGRHACRVEPARAEQLSWPSCSSRLFCSTSATVSTTAPLYCQRNACWILVVDIAEVTLIRRTSACHRRRRPPGCVAIVPSIVVAAGMYCRCSFDLLVRVRRSSSDVDWANFVRCRRWLSREVYWCGEDAMERQPEEV